MISPENRNKANTIEAQLMVPFSQCAICLCVFINFSLNVFSSPGEQSYIHIKVFPATKITPLLHRGTQRQFPPKCFENTF